MVPRASVISRPVATAKRNVKKVPFVELMNGRVQGVVSSGSDAKRVYVSFVEAKTGNFYCCTNNNRQCGGLYGASCKHINTMISEALLQFGPSAVANYLGLDGDDESYKGAHQIVGALNGSLQKEPPATVFSRFLSYLRYCELQAEAGTVHEMSWFVS